MSISPMEGRECKLQWLRGQDLNLEPWVKSPDGISIELLQEGKPLAPAEPWQSMGNTGKW